MTKTEARRRVKAFVTTLPDLTLERILRNAETGRMDFYNPSKCLLGTAGNYDKLHETKDGSRAEEGYRRLATWLPYHKVEQATRDAELSAIVRSVMAKRERPGLLRRIGSWLFSSKRMVTA